MLAGTFVYVYNNLHITWQSWYNPSITSKVMTQTKVGAQTVSTEHSWCKSVVLNGVKIEPLVVAGLA